MKHLVLAADPEETVAELRSFAPPPAEVSAAVTQIVSDVRAQGDAAVRAHTARLDKVELSDDYGLPAAALEAALRGLRPELRAAPTLWAWPEPPRCGLATVPSRIGSPRASATAARAA